jgi:hypothetical protein
LKKSKERALSANRSFQTSLKTTHFRVYQAYHTYTSKLLHYNISMNV